MIEGQLITRKKKEKVERNRNSSGGDFVEEGKFKITIASAICLLMRREIVLSLSLAKSEEI